MKQPVLLIHSKAVIQENIGKLQNESRDQVFRYIRLAYLIPELLDRGWRGRYRTQPRRRAVLSFRRTAKSTAWHNEPEWLRPLLRAEIRMKKQAQQNTLSSDSIYEIMSVEENRQTLQNAEQRIVDLRLVLRTLRGTTDIKELPLRSSIRWLSV